MGLSGEAFVVWTEVLPGFRLWRMKHFIPPTLLLFSAAICLPAQTSRDLVPGIAAPASGVVFGLDQRAAAPALLQLHPSEIHLNTRAAGNFARSMVYAGPRSNVELKGSSAAVSFHTSKATFFVHLVGDDPELMRTRVTLVALEPGKDKRIVSVWSANVFGGGRARHYDEVAVEKEDLLDGTWLRLQPQQALPPGEYGITFLPKDANLMPDSVYDFDVSSESAELSK